MPGSRSVTAAATKMRIGIRETKLAYGAPWSLDDGKLNDWNGGRGVYFSQPRRLSARTHGRAAVSFNPSVAAMRCEHR
jgi:hypothetical protein